MQRRNHKLCGAKKSQSKRSQRFLVIYLLFNVFFSSFVVGDSTIECSKKMDSSNGQLSVLQAKWKLSRDGECSNGWNSFFEAVGGTVLEKNTVAEWINQCVQKANARGKSYGGGGGGKRNNIYIKLCVCITSIYFN